MSGIEIVGLIPPFSGFSMSPLRSAVRSRIPKSLHKHFARQPRAFRSFTIPSRLPQNEYPRIIQIRIHVLRSSLLFKSCTEKAVRLRDILREMELAPEASR